MADESGIEWTTHSFSPWRGCEKVSPACKNCYAASQAKRNPGLLGIWGSEALGGTRVVAAEAAWRDVYKWDRRAKLAADLFRSVGGDPSAPGTVARDGRLYSYSGRPRVFVGHLQDLFEPWTGPLLSHTGAELRAADGPYGLTADGVWTASGPRPLSVHHVRARLFHTITECPNLDFLLLTKRPRNANNALLYALDPDLTGGAECAEPHPLDIAPFSELYPNVWVGVTAEDQPHADMRVPELLRFDAAVRFVSCEPLLGRIDLSHWLGVYKPERAGPGVPWSRSVARPKARLHWVIAGGESGTGRRELDLAHLADLREQCAAAGVGFFCKQDSAPTSGQQGRIPLNVWNTKEAPACG